MKVDPIEINNGNSIPTYFLLEKLGKLHKGHEFHFIMGTDLLPSLHLWDEGAKFIKKHHFAILERTGSDNTNLRGHANWPKHS